MALTPNGISSAASGATLPELRLQILSAKPKGQDHSRLQMRLSDGTHFSQAIVTKQGDDLLHRMVTGAILVVTQYVVNTVNNRKVLILIKVSSVLPPTAQIGSPVDFHTGAPAKPAATAAPSAGASSYGAPAASSTYAPYGGGAKYGGGAVHAAAPSMPTVPIEALNPYTATFTIKCRVTSKDPIRTWTNDRGNGKVFSVDLLDEHGGEIRGTFFNKQVDDFHDLLQEGKVYYFKGGRVKLANKRYSSLNNDYSISFDRNTTIVQAPDDSAISRLNYRFVPIKAIANMKKNDRVDVCAVLRNPQDVRDINTRSGKTTTKRDVELVDESGASIMMTLWGDKTELPDQAFSGPIIVAVKGGVVGDYNGKTLGTWSSTRVDYNPDIPEGAKLHQWMTSTPGALDAAESLSRQGGGGGSSGGFSDVKQRKQLSAIMDEAMGGEERGSVIDVKTTILFIRPGSKNWYPACPLMKDGRKCQKRVQEEGGGRWRCEPCNATVTPEYRYILSCNVGDHSGSSWVTMFDDAAKRVVGCPAGDLAELFTSMPEEEAQAQVDRKFKEASFGQYNMRCRVRMETYNDTQRLKVSALRVNPIEYATECKALLDAIRRFT